jgi:hypothetical protein
MAPSPTFLFGVISCTGIYEKREGNTKYCLAVVIALTFFFGLHFLSAFFD